MLGFFFGGGGGNGKALGSVLFCFFFHSGKIALQEACVIEVKV